MAPQAGLKFISVEENSKSHYRYHQIQKNGPGCHGWLPLNPPKWGITTTNNFHHRVGLFYVSQDAQGYLASGDAYSHRYDEIIKNIPCKKKICQWYPTLWPKHKRDLLSHSRVLVAVWEKWNCPPQRWISILSAESLSLVIIK